MDKIEGESLTSSRRLLLIRDLNGDRLAGFVFSEGTGGGSRRPSTRLRDLDLRRGDATGRRADLSDAVFILSTIF